MAKLRGGAAIVSCTLRSQPDVVEIDPSSRQYRRRNGQIAAPGCLLGIGSIIEESDNVFDRLQGEDIPPRPRGLRNPAHPIEAQFHIRSFVVVEETARSQYRLLAAEAQTTAIFATYMRTYLDKCLMHIPGVLIHSSPGPTCSPGNIIELKLREQPEIAPRMQIEMRHHAAKNVPVVVLRAFAQHPVIVVFVFGAILQPEREIPLRIVAQANVFCGIKEVRMQRRASQKAPVLLCGKWVQRGPGGIAQIARWLRIRCLSEHTTEA